VALTWAWVIGRLWLLSPSYLTQTNSRRTGDIVSALGPHHLSIAGLVLAALSLGAGFQSVAPLLVVSLCAFMFAYVVGGTPRSNQTLIGGDAMAWAGIVTLLAAVFGYSQRIGPAGEAGAFIATMAAFRGSLVNAHSFVTDAKAGPVPAPGRAVPDAGYIRSDASILNGDRESVIPAGRQPGILFFPGVGAGGAALFWLLNGPLAWIPLSAPVHVWDLVFLGLTLIGLLLVPASIFVAGVGSMFSNYDRATPVTLIGGWSGRIFRVVAFSAGYGFLAGAYIVFDQAISGAAVLMFFCLVAIGLANAIWLVDASMSLLDPDRLTQRIANYVVRPASIGPIGRPNRARVNQVIDDLSRLARGLADRRRPTAAAHAIDRMTDVWRREQDRIGDDQRGLISRVLGECAARNNGDLNRAIAHFTATSGIGPDAYSERRTLRRLTAEEYFAEPEEFEHRSSARLRGLGRRLTR
jgi:hypothetical protein